jgi:hypothetical protein
VFVHIGAVERAGMRDLNEGQKISYEVSQKGARASHWRTNLSRRDGGESAKKPFDVVIG